MARAEKTPSGVDHAHSIAEALKQTREALRDGEPAYQALAEAAADHQLAEQLLMRKFWEQHGTSPEAWREEEQRRTVNVQQSVGAKIEDRRLEVRKRYAERYGCFRGDQLVDDSLGEPFEKEGKVFWFVCIGVGTDNWAIYAEGVTPGELLKIRLHSKSELDRFLEELGERTLRRKAAQRKEKRSAQNRRRV
jgi:hypothetical protein